MVGKPPALGTRCRWEPLLHCCFPGLETARQHFRWKIDDKSSFSSSRLTCDEKAAVGADDGGSNERIIRSRISLLLELEKLSLRIHAVHAHAAVASSSHKFSVGTHTEKPVFVGTGTRFRYERHKRGLFTRHSKLAPNEYGCYEARAAEVPATTEWIRRSTPVSGSLVKGFDEQDHPKILTRQRTIAQVSGS